jgi:hypothetical protein
LQPLRYPQLPFINPLLRFTLETASPFACRCRRIVDELRRVVERPLVADWERTSSARQSGIAHSNLTLQYRRPKTCLRVRYKVGNILCIDLRVNSFRTLCRSFSSSHVASSTLNAICVSVSTMQRSKLARVSTTVVLMSPPNHCSSW